MYGTYRVGIIGAKLPHGSEEASSGLTCGLHAQAYLRERRVRLFGACDPEPRNLQHFRNYFSVEKTYTDYRDMFSQECPDIVSICSPVCEHRQILEAAVNAGAKAVLCDAPLVKSPREIRAITDLVVRTGVKLCVSNLHRYHPAYRYAARIVREGTIGTPVICSTVLCSGDKNSTLDSVFDIVQMLLTDSRPEWIMGQARAVSSQEEGSTAEHGLAVVGFYGGARALVETGHHLSTCDLVVTGTAGCLVLGKCGATVRVWTADGREDRDFAQEESARQEYLWDKTIAGMVDWLDGAIQPVTGYDTSVRALEMQFGSYLSMIRGDRVDFPYTDSLNEWPPDALSRQRMPASAVVLSEQRHTVSEFSR